MAEIIVAEITCHDGYSQRTLNFATQGFVGGAAPIVDPTLHPLITFTRSSTGTRFNSSGVIESIAANLPRFNYDPVTRAIKGLLIEESRQNVLLNSLINGTNLSTQSVTTSAAQYTLTFYGVGSITLSGTYSATVFGSGTFPTRTTLTFTPTAGSLTLTVTGTVQYAQLELGGFATSFIPTAGVAVTRSADVASVDTMSPWFSQNEGTFLAEADATSTATTAANIVQTVDGVSNNNRVALAHNTDNTSLLQIRTSGSVAVTLTFDTLANGVTAKYGAAYKTGQSAGSVNGSTPTTSATAFSFSASMTTMKIGANQAGAAFLNGHIKRVIYYPTRLTDAQLQAATGGWSIPSGFTLDLNFCGTASAHFDGRINQPGNIQRNVFNNRSTFGRTQVGYGELSLVNNDGALDALGTYGFAGFNITIRRGVMYPNQSAPTWTTVLTGLMESADFSWDEVSIKVRDRQQELDKPLQATRYAGSNSLPNGLEGVANDLKGKPKPILYGKAFNFSPPCVNTSRNIYQISDGLIQSIDNVFDRGVALNVGAAYTSQSDMETNAPAAGQYRLWNDATAGAFIRLYGTPTGIVTVDATQGASSGVRTVAQLMSLILQKGGIASADINSSDITALDAAANYQVGYWVGHTDEMTGIQVLDMICNSAGAYWGVDRLGKFRMAQLVDPTSGSSVGTLQKVDIIKIDRVRSTDPGSGIPAWQIKLNWGLYQTVLSDLGATSNAAVQSERANKYRQIIANDATVKTQWPKAVEIEFDTCIAGSSDASTEVTRRFNIYKARRDTLNVSVRLDDALIAAIDLGSVITLDVPRFNYSGGKKFLVTGIRTNLRNNIFDLTLWG